MPIPLQPFSWTFFAMSPLSLSLLFIHLLYCQATQLRTHIVEFAFQQPTIYFCNLRYESFATEFASSDTTVWSIQLSLNVVMLRSTASTVCHLLYAQTYYYTPI